MDNILVEDFQSYHNRDSLDYAPSPPREHEEDSDPFSSPSPTAHHGSPRNETIFDLPTRASSPDTSPQHSDDDISVLLSDYHHSRPASQHHPSSQHQSSSPFTPIKLRPSGFRNPSSVRAMRDTTPPLYHLTPPLSTGSKHQSGSYFPIPSRKGTPRSHQRSPSKTSPSKRVAAKKEYPLVLLHVTLLPIPTPYSNSVMERVLPAYILSNWKLLREKMTATVLDRGILIPHPREDYDLLEERLLESLELRMPRILACGHFHLDADEEAELLAAGEDIEEEDNDADICADCGRRVRDGRYGAGTGSRRWDIKLYAANGLMRAGAWGAAWREMERVDVEVCPWLGEDLKGELEIAREAEEQDEALRLASEEEVTPNIRPEEDTQMEDGPTSGGLDDARMKEIYGEDARAYTDELHASHSPSPSPKRSPPSPFIQQPPSDELPLSTLLLNYLAILSRDPRNVAIALLSLLVLFLAVVSRFSSKTASMMPLPSDYVPQRLPTANRATNAASTISPSLSSVMPSSSYSTVDPAPAERTADHEQAGTPEEIVEDLEAKFEFD